MTASNGETPSGPLELTDVLNIETNDGVTLPFEVVGILEDPETQTSYAVLVHQPAGEHDHDHAHDEGAEHDDGEFIVTDLDGNLLEDEELAQDILDEFLVFAEEAGDGPEEDA